MSELRRLNPLSHQQQEQDPFWDNSLAAQFRSSLTRIAKQQNWPLPSAHTTQPDTIADKPLDRSFLNICNQSFDRSVCPGTRPGHSSRVFRDLRIPIEMACALPSGLVGPEHADGVQFCLQGRPTGRQSVTWCFKSRLRLKSETIGQTSCLPCNWWTKVRRSTSTKNS